MSNVDTLIAHKKAQAAQLYSHIPIWLKAKEKQMHGTVAKWQDLARTYPELVVLQDYAQLLSEINGLEVERDQAQGEAKPTPDLTLRRTRAWHGSGKA